MSDICYIIGAGEITPSGYKAEESDYIICADGGYKYRDLLGKDCDMVVGDFDSLGQIPETNKKIVAPCEKDETDMMLAVDCGLRKGYKAFIIFGALGGERNDHSVANIQLLHYIASKGARGSIIHGDEIFICIKNDTLYLEDNLKGYISVFSLSDECRGVTIKNLKYPLENALLSSFNPIGVSNEFVGKKAEISVKDGALLVVYKKEAD